MIMASVGNGPFGNIAVDDVTVTFGACPVETTVSDDDDDDVTTVSDDDDDVTTASDDDGDDYDVGDVVASCDFDSSVSPPDGLTTGCTGVDLSPLGDTDFWFASGSNSADTGPAADHTGGGGKSNNRSSSRSEKKI